MPSGQSNTIAVCARWMQAPAPVPRKMSSMPGRGGVVAAGVLLGVVESLWGGFVSTGYMDVIGFVMVILILLFRPTGLFSRRPGR